MATSLTSIFINTICRNQVFLGNNVSKASTFKLYCCFVFRVPQLVVLIGVPGIALSSRQVSSCTISPGPVHVLKGFKQHFNVNSKYLLKRELGTDLEGWWGNGEWEWGVLQTRSHHLYVRLHVVYLVQTLALYTNRLSCKVQTTLFWQSDTAVVLGWRLYIPQSSLSDKCEQSLEIMVIWSYCINPSWFRGGEVNW